MTESNTTDFNSPYHAGEKTIHERLGIADQQEEKGKSYIRPFMPDQHREFFSNLPFLVVGSVDEKGWPWASILFDEPGFISTPDDTHIQIAALPHETDPLSKNIKPDAPLSFLGIEMHTRRRNRVNVSVDSVSENGFATRVDQSFGNCPQYINHREPTTSEHAPSANVTVRKFTTLDMAVQQTIEEADFFFVASHVKTETDRKTQGVDVNHRGGVAGFTKVDGNSLIVPDYRGNFAFNTLGNFVVNPMAGLVFYNRGNRSLIQMVGRVEIIWDDDPLIAHFEGAQRAWRFHLDHGIERMNSVPMIWKLESYSPSFKRSKR
jgi:predicted pyridoxine 5'-phosphate oxidase superfamily flavin-nucleotide-binding protein